MKRSILTALAAGALLTGATMPYQVVQAPNGRSHRRGRVRRFKGKVRQPRFLPHGSPTFVAICRREDGTSRRYFTCRTREQALMHRPYLLEHVNGWGQVKRRERFTAGARDAV